MIFTSVHSVDDGKAYPQAVQKVIAFLKTNDILNMEPGTYEIEGKDIYVTVMDIQTGTLEEKRPETHEKYLDVQYLASGEEKLGFTPDTGNYQAVYKDEEHDVALYDSVENENFVHALPGCISIFLPCDVHRPGVAVNEPMTIRKAVGKVNMALI